MRCYKLAYSGAAPGLGLGQLQILNSGRVRSVNVAAIIRSPAAEDHGVIVSVAVNAINETGQSTATPNNFAHASARAVGAAAAVGLASICHAQDVDFPVVAGQQLCLNIEDIVGVGAGAAFIEECEVLVWVG